MDALRTIEVMKELKDFDKLNRFVLKQGKEFDVKGNSKFKDFELEVLNSKIKFDNDITEFTFEGEGLIKKKKLVGSKIERIHFSLNTTQKTLDTNFNNKNVLLALLVLVYFAFLKDYAKKAREKYAA